MQSALSDSTLAKIYFIPFGLIPEKGELGGFCLFRFGFFFTFDCTGILCAKKPLKRNRMRVRDYVRQE